MLVMVFWGSHCHFWCLRAASAPHHLHAKAWAASRAAWPRASQPNVRHPVRAYCGWRSTAARPYPKTEAVVFAPKRSDWPDLDLLRAQLKLCNKSNCKHACATQTTRIAKNAAKSTSP